MMYFANREWRVIGRQQMRADHVFDVDAAIEELVGFGVGVGVGLAYRAIVVLFGKETRGAQHDGAKRMTAREQLAQILRGRLGDAIDIFRDRRDVFRDPGRRLARRRHQRIAEHACGAGVDKRRDASGGGFFEQIERA